MTAYRPQHQPMDNTTSLLLNVISKKRLVNTRGARGEPKNAQSMRARFVEVFAPVQLPRSADSTVSSFLRVLPFAIKLDACQQHNGKANEGSTGGQRPQGTILFNFSLVPLCHPYPDALLQRIDTFVRSCTQAEHSSIQQAKVEGHSGCHVSTGGKVCEIVWKWLRSQFCHAKRSAAMQFACKIVSKQLMCYFASIQLQTGRFQGPVGVRGAPSLTSTMVTAFKKQFVLL